MHDNVSRIKRSSPLGTTLFLTVRTLDPLLQYSILAKGLALPLLTTINAPLLSPSSHPPFDFGMPLRSLVIIAMAVGSSLKQNYNLAFISEQEMPASAGLTIPLFNTLFNSLNSILSLTTAATAFTPAFLTAENDNGVSPLLVLSSAAYLLGILTELGAEWQRREFLWGGLFGWARHVNYGAYTVWRAAYAMLGGGWVWGVVVGGFFAGDFVGRGVPVLDGYCEGRYGAAWVEYKKKVPYKLWPGIY
ncbi:hypothetical protein DL98DRAFT_563810 [Cadophora sp. DSE1049]|nr:hypothetical protein DL98DRAFT_563810 [Cadophora sp. DSE1049]